MPAWVNHRPEPPVPDSVASSVAFASLRPASAIGGGFYVAFGFWIVAGSRDPAAFVIAAICVVLGASLLAIRLGLASRRATLIEQRAQAIIFVICAATLVVPVLTIWATKLAYPATGMKVLIVVIGAFVHSRFGYTTIVATAVTALIVLANMLGIPVSWAQFATELVIVVTGGVCVHAAVRHVVRKLDAARQEVSRLANTDDLTGVANARCVYETGRSLAAGMSDGEPLGLLYIDSDDLKALNDAHGHQAGDEYLRQLARALTDEIVPEAMVGRVGGDEFIAILPAEDLAGLARIRERADNKLSAAGISASIGIAAASSAHDFDTLVRQADLDMYENKRGRSLAGAPEPLPVSPDLT